MNPIFTRGERVPVPREAPLGEEREPARETSEGELVEEEFGKDAVHLRPAEEARVEREREQARPAPPRTRCGVRAPRRARSFTQGAG